MGEIILERFNGKEKYTFDAGEIFVHRDEEWMSLVFSVKANGTAVEGLPDTMELDAVPSFEAFVVIEKLDKELLKDNTFYIPTCYNETLDMHLSTIYYVSHEDLDNNDIKVKHLRGDLYEVEWKAKTMDVNYYDGSKSDTIVSISGIFKWNSEEMI